MVFKGASASFFFVQILCKRKEHALASESKSTFIYI